jgi:hypothetical protein
VVIMGCCVCVADFTPYCSGARAEKMELDGYCRHLVSLKMQI